VYQHFENVHVFRLLKRNLFMFLHAYIPKHYWLLQLAVLTHISFWVVLQTDWYLPLSPFGEVSSKSPSYYMV